MTVHHSAPWIPIRPGPRTSLAAFHVRTVMILNRSSHRERFRSLNLGREVVWGMIAACLLTGCQSLSAVLKDPDSKPHEFAVDLSVDEDEDTSDSSWATKNDLHTAHADYDAVKSQSVSQQDEEVSRKGSITSGHSFAPRRLTLRRPVPVPEGSSNEGAFDESNIVTAEVPRDEAPSSSSATENASSPPMPDFNKPPASRNTMWQDESGLSAWKSNGASSPDKAGGTAGPSQKAIDRSRPTSTPRASNSASSAPKNEVPSGRVDDGSDEKAMPLGATKSQVPKPPNAPRNQSGNSAQGMPAGAPPSSEQPNEESAQTSSAAASPETPAEAAPEAEPGVFERLRGLYTPRSSDTDKLRRQMRKLSDPFGLLKERDEDAGPTSSIEEPATNQTADAGDTATTETTTTQPPVDAKQPTAEQLLESAITQAESELENWPRTPSGRPDQLSEWRRRQTDLRLLYLLAGRSADSVRIIESLPEEEQEFWQSLMLAMHSYRSGEQSEDLTAHLTEALDHLRTAEKRLQPLTPLKIRRAAFCDRIDGFGQITEFPATDFDPGQRVLIYVDVRNFRTELTAQGRFRSEFAAVIEYQREDDDDVTETVRLPQILDECDVERTDYFQSFELTIPALAGRYTARVRLKDLQSLQTAEANLEFTVRSQQAGQ